MPEPSFRPYLLLCWFSALWLGGTSALQAAFPASQALRVAVLAVTVGLLLTIAALPQRYGRVKVERGGSVNDASSNGADDDEPQAVAADSGPILGECDLAAAVKQHEFWLVFTIFAVTAGSGLLVVNSLGQMATAFAAPGDPASRANLVTVCSVCNFGGRSGFGLASDRWPSIGRTGFFALSSLLMVAATLLLLGGGGALYPAVFLTGLAYGGCFSMVAALTADLFGRKHFAGNYGALDFAPSIGGLVYATLIARPLYDAESAAQGSDDCQGTACFGAALALASASSVVVAIPAAVMLRRRVQLRCRPLVVGMSDR